MNKNIVSSNKHHAQLKCPDALQNLIIKLSNWHNIANYTKILLP